MTSQPEKKILVRSPNWVGDAIMATPVPRVLKQTWPESRIHVLAKPWAAPVWENHPDVEKVILLGSREALARNLRQEKYDLGLVLPNSFSSAWLVFWAGCKQRVGYAGEFRSWLLTRPLPWNQPVRHSARPQVYLNLAAAAGAKVAVGAVWPFTVQVTAEELTRAQELLGSSDQRPWVGLAPGSVALSRRWPAERYSQLSDRLVQLGCRVVLLGSGSDAEIAQAVAEQAKFPPLILAGKTNLREALAVIRCLNLLVSNDSGAMHEAYAQDVPVLVLQGAADPAVTGPFGPRSRMLRTAGLDCAPCVRNDCPRGLACMLAISVEEVFTTVAEMLALRGPGKDKSHGN